jgi:hypothetical protein
MTTAIGTYATPALLKAQVQIGDTTDDTVLGYICDRINQYIETSTGRVLAPVSSATFTIDIAEPCRAFYFKRGVRAISAISVGDYTGQTRTALASTDYFLRPSEHDRLPGWPATWVHLSDYGSRTSFPRGFDIVSMTATTGWTAIPDDITEVALVAATRAWHALQSGQSDVVGTDDMGAPVVSRFFSARDLGTLRRYSVDLPG